MFIRQRISTYLQIKGITRYRFYRQTGLSNGFLDKDGSINSDNCEKICNCFPDLNPEWLLLERGTMFREPQEELAGESGKPPVELLVQKVIELSAENSLLKREIETLKSCLPMQEVIIHKINDEDDHTHEVAAENLK